VCSSFRFRVLAICRDDGWLSLATKLITKVSSVMTAVVVVVGGGGGGVILVAAEDILRKLSRAQSPRRYGLPSLYIPDFSALGGSCGSYIHI